MIFPLKRLVGKRCRRLQPFAIFTSRGLERALLCWKGKAIRKSLGLTPDLFHKKCSLFSLRKRKENV
ncbi:hypothetical protein CH238_03750 [[Clostridium] leptum DSM 753]|nr:hypothetical protein CH238_03750 [[Clostridium] leptum DSM 753]